jgi:hypothetical protein
MVLQVFEAMEAQKHLVAESAAELFWRLRQWPLQMADALEATVEHMQRYHSGFKDQLQQDQQQLAEELARLQVGSCQGAACCWGVCGASCVPPLPRHGML